MSNRITICPLIFDPRNAPFQKAFNKLEIKGKVEKVFVFDSYIFDANLSELEIKKVAKSLTNDKIENYSVNNIPNLKNYDYICEIGYLPGVFHDALQLHQHVNFTVF